MRCFFGCSYCDWSYCPILYLFNCLSQGLLCCHTHISETCTQLPHSLFTSQSRPPAQNYSYDELGLKMERKKYAIMNCMFAYMQPHIQLFQLIGFIDRHCECCMVLLSWKHIVCPPSIMHNLYYSCTRMLPVDMLCCVVCFTVLALPRVTCSL